MRASPFTVGRVPLGVIADTGNPSPSTSRYELPGAIAADIARQIPYTPPWAMTAPPRVTWIPTKRSA